MEIMKTVLGKSWSIDPHLAGDRFGVSFKNYAFSDYYMSKFPTLVKLPAFTPLTVFLLLITLSLASWVGLLVVSITLIVLFPNITVLAWLLIPILLIMLFALMLSVSIFMGLYAVYTKTTKAHGLENQINFGGVELSTYTELKTEALIQSLYQWDGYSEHMEEPDGKA
jgi:hypothetical protein